MQTWNEIIELLNQKGWVYEIIEDRIELILGNEELSIPKNDEKALEELLDDIKTW